MYYKWVIGILALAGLDTIFVINFATGWFKKDSDFDDFFPEWKYTRKKRIWAIVWFICIYFNVGIACLRFVMEDTKLNVIILVLSSSFGYWLFLGIIYMIVKHSIRYYYDKKIEQRRMEKRLKKLRQKKFQEQIDKVTADTSVGVDTPVSVDITNTESTIDCESTDDTTNTINNND